MDTHLQLVQPLAGGTKDVGLQERQQRLQLRQVVLQRRAWVRDVVRLSVW